LKNNKKLERQRLFDALNNEQNPKLIVDCDFSQHMGLQEKKSLAMQVQIIVGEMKKFEKPFGLYLVNMKDEETVKQFEIRDVHNMPIKVIDGTLESLVNDKTVYLSPDAP
jgi:Trm5-related predicted tRNA methylase